MSVDFFIREFVRSSDAEHPVQCFPLVTVDAGAVCFSHVQSTQLYRNKLLISAVNILAFCFGDKLLSLKTGFRRYAIIADCFLWSISQVASRRDPRGLHLCQCWIPLV